MSSFPIALAVLFFGCASGPAGTTPRETQPSVEAPTGVSAQLDSVAVTPPSTPPAGQPEPLDSTLDAVVQPGSEQAVASEALDSATASAGVSAQSPGAPPANTTDIEQIEPDAVAHPDRDSDRAPPGNAPVQLPDVDVPPPPAPVTADPSAPLAVAVDALLDAPPMDQVSFGVLAVEAGTGEVLYARNAHRKFIPASNQKLLVAAAGLSLLGPDYRYETALWASGPVRNGAIEGDLVLVGTGDPSLSARSWESGEAALENLAGRLREAGVRRVRGALVVDASAWDSTSVAPTREVEDLRWEQAATGGVFAIDEGEVTARVTASSEEGELAGVSWRPLGTDDFVVSRVLTSSLDARTDLDPYYLPESRRIELLGHIRVGRTARVTFAQRDPVRQATAALVRALAGAEIEADQGSRVVWERDELLRGGCSTGSVPTCGGAQRLASLRSPPMHELVTGILGPSQNWMAEQLLLTLGAERGEGGSWPDGTEVLTTFLAQDVGVARLDVAPRDASGMSFYNLVTPRALVQVLQYMARGQNAAAFRSALAEPGVDGATLSNRLSGLEGRVFAKTGSISNVNALSGYVVRSDGSEVVFSILSNGSGLPYSRVRRALDGLVRVLAR